VRLELPDLLHGVVVEHPDEHVSAPQKHPLLLAHDKAGGAHQLVAGQLEATGAVRKRKKRSAGESGEHTYIMIKPDGVLLGLVGMRFSWASPARNATSR